MKEQEANRLVDELFESWAPSLYRYAYGATHSHAAAEDLVQETFFYLYQEIRQGRAIANPRGWTLIVVRNLASKLRRSSARHPDDLLPLDAFDRMEGRPDVDGDVGADSLLPLLSELSSRESEVLLLRL